MLVCVRPVLSLYEHFLLTNTSYPFPLALLSMKSRPSSQLHPSLSSFPFPLPSPKASHEGSCICSSRTKFCEHEDFICSTVCSFLTFMLSFNSSGTSCEWSLVPCGTELIQNHNIEKINTETRDCEWWTISTIRWRHLRGLNLRSSPVLLQWQVKLMLVEENASEEVHCETPLKS